MLLEYSADRNTISEVASYAHGADVWALSSSPADASLLATCNSEIQHTNTLAYRVTIYRLPALEAGGAAAHSLTELAIAPAARGRPLRALFHGTSKTDDTMLVIESHGLRLLALGKGGATESSAIALDAGAVEVGDGARNVHEAACAVASVGQNVVGFDLRTCAPTFEIVDAHCFAARAVSYNPNKLYDLASAGDDGLLKFWDVRRTASPVHSLRAHDHWIWDLAYNASYDQLVLTGSTDHTVKLWHVASLSSAETAASTARRADGLAKAYLAHSDAVHGVAWAASDASWTCASVSYDGRVAVHHVPEDVKMEALMAS